MGIKSGSVFGTKKSGFTLTKIFNFIPALVLNLLKDLFERSRISFNKFRTSAQGTSKNQIKVKRVGFTLLELLIVIAIIGILGAIIMPNFQGKAPRYERESFIARFNTLVQYGWQQALLAHKTHRITVDIGKKIITLTVDSGQKDRSGENAFVPLVNPVQDAEISIPEQIVIKQFFIEGFDMMAKFARSKTASVWFYIVPEGMVQNVVINFTDTKDTKDDQARPVGLVLNPFSALFKVYDTFQKP